MINYKKVNYKTYTVQVLIYGAVSNIYKVRLEEGTEENYKKEIKSLHPSVRDVEVKLIK